MPIRAITFDLDDTLWSIAPVIERAERLMYQWLIENCPRVVRHYSREKLGQKRAEIELQRSGGAHDFGLMRRRVLARAMLPLGCDQKMVEDAYQVFFTARNQVELFPDVEPALARLSDRYQLAALSNGNADVQLIGLGRYLKVSLHASEVGHLKPHPEIFHAAARRLGLPAGEILHIGDHLQHDVAGALGAGMRALWLNRDPRQSTPDSIEMISSLEQLPARVDSML